MAAFAPRFGHAGMVRAQVTGIGLQHYQPGAAIDDQHITIVGFLQQMWTTHHQWQMQTAGQDGAVREGAAAGGDHADHALRLQQCQLGGGHAVGHQNFARHALQHCMLAVQCRMQAADDLIDVVDAAAQVRIVHAFEYRSQAVALQAQGVVGRIMAGANQIINAREQLGVIQQQRMQVDEFTNLVRQCAVQAVAQIAHFRTHRGHCSVKALQLSRNCLGRDFGFFDIQRMR